MELMRQVVALWDKLLSEALGPPPPAQAIPLRPAN
jgi:hypothetical protein